MKFAKIIEQMTRPLLRFSEPVAKPAHKVESDHTQDRQQGAVEDQSRRIVFQQIVQSARRRHWLKEGCGSPGFADAVGVVTIIMTHLEKGVHNCGVLSRFFHVGNWLRRFAGITVNRSRGSGNRRRCNRYGRYFGPRFLS